MHYSVDIRLHAVSRQFRHFLGDSRDELGVCACSINHDLRLRHHVMCPSFVFVNDKWFMLRAGTFSVHRKSLALYR